MTEGLASSRTPRAPAERDAIETPRRHHPEPLDIGLVPLPVRDHAFDCIEIGADRPVPAFSLPNSVIEQTIIAYEPLTA